MWSLALVAGLSHASPLLDAVPPGDHARQHARFGAQPAIYPPPPSGTPLPPPSAGPDMTVYGYQAYWDDDLYTVPWDDLSHIALFAAEVSDTGTLSYTSRWDDAATAIALAQPYGVKVHLCVINFSTSSLETLLGNATYRETLLDELESWVLATGADGVNVDFEGLPYSRKQEMVDFTADLEARVGEVVLATPAVDWSGAWDYDALTQHADLFIMGYGYHWSGSSEAGPTDPLYSGVGTVWAGSHSLTWSVDDYLFYGADPARVILGLPLYGYSYPTANNNVPTSNLGIGDSVFMADALAEAAVHGANDETTSVSSYYFDGANQVWYPDIDSVRERIQYVESAGIGGFGFWALHYDDDEPAFWAMVHDETTSPSPGTDPTDTGTGGTPGNPELVADAGRPFLAYVGDTIVLSGEGSRGPADVALQFAWTQVAGPPVALVEASSATPSFLVEAVGTHVFELVVGDGTTWSAPASSHVVVVDPAAGTRHEDPAGCGCRHGAGGLGGWLLLPLIVLLAGRRRER